jgi:hypothetical protein
LYQRSQAKLFASFHYPASVPPIGANAAAEGKDSSPRCRADCGNYLHIFSELTVWPKEAIDFWKRCATMMPQTAEKGQIHT